jgi:ribosomal-protein-alanine N-acetyltransferase
LTPGTPCALLTVHERHIIKRQRMVLTLRQACVTDLPSVYRGEQEYIQRWEPDHEEAWRHDLERQLTRWVENFDRLTIATIDEQFAGYCLWTHAQGRAELCTLHVSRQFRRNGIGRALFEAYARSAAAHGIAHLTLSVRSDNPARHLYQQTGFVCTASDTRGYLIYERQTPSV